MKVGGEKADGKKIDGKEVGSKEAGSKEAGSKKVSGFLVDFAIALLWCFARFDKECFSIYFLKLY